MTKLTRPRWVVRLRALVLGYFWLPCPMCGRHFAGFESAPDPTGHLNAVPNVQVTSSLLRHGVGDLAAPLTGETLICLDCASAARGCQAWRNSGLPKVRVSLACTCPKPRHVAEMRAMAVDYEDTNGAPVSHVMIPKSLLDTQ